MNLRKLTNTGSTETNLGEMNQYRMEIWLSTVTNMDLLVEIFTSDPETEETTFALCDPVVAHGGSAISSDQGSLTSLKPTMYENKFYKAIVSMHTVSVGQVGKGRFYKI